MKDVHEEYDSEPYGTLSHCARRPECCSFFCQSFSVINSSWVTGAAVPPSDSCRNNEGGRAVPQCIRQRPDGGMRRSRIMSTDRCLLLTNRNLSAVSFTISQKEDILFYRAERRAERFSCFVSQSEHNASCVHQKLFSAAGMFVFFSFANILNCRSWHLSFA